MKLKKAETVSVGLMVSCTVVTVSVRSPGKTTDTGVVYKIIEIGLVIVL